MSYLTRISARIMESGTNTHAIMPKGLKNLQPAAIARMEETEEEETKLSTQRTTAARKIRRQENQEESEDAQRQPKEESEEEVAPLRRQEAEEEQEVAPLRRQEAEEEEELATLRRMKTEEDEVEQLAPLRRQEEEDEEQLSPLRRQVEEEEEEIQPMRTISRQEEIPLENTGQTAPPPAQESLEPGAEPVSQELAGEEEPSKLQALHRDMSSAMTQSPQLPAAQGETSKHHSGNNPLQDPSPPFHPVLPELPDGIGIANTAPQSTGLDDSRPNVIIDQVDVLIHEPVLPAIRSESRNNRDRSLRARYLRRL